MQKGIETIVKDQELIDRRHAQICDVALALFSQKGYHRTTVREIAAASGLGIGTLYSYIKTKEDILREILERGNRAGQFAIKDPHLVAVSLLFLCAVWDLKRWNLKAYTLETMVENLTRLILDGITADRPRGR